MSRLSVQLGPFELHEPIGKGGMGEVFRGAHRRQQVPVAVKVMTGRAVEDVRIQKAFRNEVRAAARLHHRNIVMLFDQGRVDREASAAADGNIPAGSPYLAMELVTGGTLDAARRVLDWSLLRELLLDILDALAHAHARGVLHRDLKPANVLLPGEADARDGIKITDFGIARALGQSDSAGEYELNVSGTLRYMAPEQVAGLWRDEGPWTDLYALGVIAYRFASDKRPFGDVDGDQLMHCHLHAPPAPLEPVFPVPSGFHSWVERLLAKRPANRFERAADAAWALKELSAAGVRAVPAAHAISGTIGEGPPQVDDGNDVTQPELVGESWVDADGDTAAAGAAPDGDTAAAPSVLGEADTGAVSARADAPTAESQTPRFLNWWEAAEELAECAEIPPLPSSWRRPSLQLPSMRMVGAGLGLYGLRSIPMVARDRERDLIWKRLREVGEAKRTRLVALHGDSGYGKSRIVEWVSQRAHEVGGATVLRATHSLFPGVAGGLPRMFAIHLGCVGLRPAQIRDRCRRFVNERPLPDDGDPDAEAAEIAALLSPEGAEPAPGAEGRGAAKGNGEPVRARLATPADRHRAARRLLARFGRRPVLLWLDDVHWGSDAIAFANFLLGASNTATLPILVVMTCDDDQLISRPVEASQLEETWSKPRVDRLLVGPLDKRDHFSLVQRLLGLSSDLIQQVSERTAGNPLFAVQLIGDWVQRGVLEVGDQGFDLNPNESATLPDDIHELWTDRVRQIADRCAEAEPEAAISCLEVAAALGHEVTNDEWRHACQLAAQPIPDDLLDLMISHRLAVAAGDAWSLSHSMLRESLERQSREAGRLPYLHRACALMLAERYGEDAPSVAERRGRHLLAAGELEQALEPLLRGAEHRALYGDCRLAQALYAEREAAMQTLDVPADDPRWGDGWVRRARAYVTMCDHDKAAILLDKALAKAERYGWQDIRARAYCVRGHLGIGYGDLAAAHEAFARSLELLRSLDDPAGLAECLAGFGVACRWRHELEDAARYFREAYELQEKSGDRYELGIILRGMANVKNSSGDLDEAQRLLVRARASFEESGNRFQVANCLNDLGEIARKTGKLADAEGFYRRAAELYESLGSAEATTPRFNLGLVLLAQEEYAKARAVFAAELARFPADERVLDKLWLHAGLLPCAADARDWDAWDRHLERVLALIENLVDEDIPYCAEIAGKLCAKAGQVERSRRAYELARSQLERMTREEDIARIDEALARLG